MDRKKQINVKYENSDGIELNSLDEKGIERIVNVIS